MWFPSGLPPGELWRSATIWWAKKWIFHSILWHNQGEKEESANEVGIRSTPFFEIRLSSSSPSAKLGSKLSVCLSVKTNSHFHFHFPLLRKWVDVREAANQGVTRRTCSSSSFSRLLPKLFVLPPSMTNIVITRTNKQRGLDSICVEQEEKSFFPVPFFASDPLNL